MSKQEYEGQIVDVHQQTIYSGKVTVSNGKIESIEPVETTQSTYLCPGLIDAHVHIESSMLVPTEFARLALPFGTVGTISDPHEIGNVLGVDGVKYMIENAKLTPLKVMFGAPSCVPATNSELETSGAEITASDVSELLKMPQIGYLAEVMNFPGVLQGDPELLKKINSALALNLPIDGHFPGGKGEDAKRYIEGGKPGEVTITTDHECYSLEEALSKISHGMKITIREGSAAKNFEALKDLFKQCSPEQIMLCSDDKHPNDLVLGHIDALVRRAVSEGNDPLAIITSATKTPVEHYNMDVGLLREGDPADFIRVENLEDFKVLETYIDGELVAKDGECLLKSAPITIVNKFSRDNISADSLAVTAPDAALNNSSKIRAIKVIDQEIITEEAHIAPTAEDGKLVSDTSKDLLKIVVVNRYENTPPAIAFVSGFNLKKGALASSVAHDCHNIIAVGVSDSDIANAVNAVIEAKGGVSTASNGETNLLPLPIAGLMSDQDGHTVAKQYDILEEKAKSLGSTLASPFMSLSFLALLVIPSLKLSDKGLFSGESFKFVDIYSS